MSKHQHASRLTTTICPRHSMYGIYIYICRSVEAVDGIHVGTYLIHGVFGCDATGLSAPSSIRLSVKEPQEGKVRRNSYVEVGEKSTIWRWKSKMCQLISDSSPWTSWISAGVADSTPGAPSLPVHRAHQCHARSPLPVAGGWCSSCTACGASSRVTQKFQPGGFLPNSF